MTSGNREWAFSEAQRRAGALNGAYAIYRHKRNADDYVIRTAEAAAPNPHLWQHIATFQPDGTQSFTGDDAS